MDKKKLQHYFLLGLLVGTIIITFFILRPFIYTVILALICAAVFYPVQQKMLRLAGGRQGLAALVTTSAVIIIILIPFIVLGIEILQEAKQFYLFINDGGKDVIKDISAYVTQTFKAYFPLAKPFSIDADQYINQGLTWLLNRLGHVFGSVTKLVFNFFIFIIATYYILKDGQKFKKIAIGISPLVNNDDETIFKKINIAINSVVKGSLAISLIQGALATIGFFIFGVPNALLWGAAVTVASLIPAVGTAVVMIPAVIFLFFTTSLLPAFGLLLWGGLIVGLIDNFLKPVFIGQGIKIHPLIVFLSVIGGIAFFGPIGFLLGPITLSLLYALVDVYAGMESRQSLPHNFKRAF